MRFSEKDKKKNISYCNNLKITKVNCINNLTGAYFHGQNVEKHKKDKIVTHSFPKFVNFYHFSVSELRISVIFFAILLTKVLPDNRK